MSDVTTTAATTTPITLADAKRQLNVSTTGDDTYIENLVSAATKYCEDRANRCFVTQTRTLKMRDFADRRYVHKNQYGQEEIHLPRSPLATVSSITYVAANGTTTTLSSSLYSVSTGDTPGRIRPAYNQVWPDTRSDEDNVTVVYTCGFGSTQTGQPANAQHAVRMLTAHWYRNREGVDAIGMREIPLGVDALLGEEIVPSYG